MSASERKAFIEGMKLLYDGSLWESFKKSMEAEALRRYPDSPCKSVRDIVVEWLRDNGYEGLWAASGCYCDLNCIGGGKHCQYVLECRPGVLVGGKIGERVELRQKDTLGS
jgi:hypothetical protein